MTPIETARNFVERLGGEVSWQQDDMIFFEIPHKGPIILDDLVGVGKLTINIPAVEIGGEPFDFGVIVLDPESYR